MQKQKYQSPNKFNRHPNSKKKSKNLSQQRQQRVQPWSVNESKQLLQGDSRQSLPQQSKIFTNHSKDSLSNFNQNEKKTSYQVLKEQKQQYIFMDKSVRLAVYEKQKAKHVKNLTNFVLKNKKEVFNIYGSGNKRLLQDKLNEKEDLIMQNQKLNQQSKQLNKFILLKSPESQNQDTKKQKPTVLRQSQMKAVDTIVFHCLDKDQIKPRKRSSNLKQRRRNLTFLENKQLLGNRNYNNISCLNPEKQQRNRQKHQKSNNKSSFRQSISCKKRSLSSDNQHRTIRQSSQIMYHKKSQNSLQLCKSIKPSKSKNKFYIQYLQSLKRPNSMMSTFIESSNVSHKITQIHSKKYINRQNRPKSCVIQRTHYQTIQQHPFTDNYQKRRKQLSLSVKGNGCNLHSIYLD